jgi:hypothetical protein
MREVGDFPTSLLRRVSQTTEQKFLLEGLRLLETSRLLILVCAQIHTQLEINEIQAPLVPKIKLFGSDTWILSSSS